MSEYDGPDERELLVWIRDELVDWIEGNKPSTGGQHVPSFTPRLQPSAISAIRRMVRDADACLMKKDDHFLSRADREKFAGQKHEATCAHGSKLASIPLCNSICVGCGHVCGVHSHNGYAMGCRWCGCIGYIDHKAVLASGAVEKKVGALSEVLSDR